LLLGANNSIQHAAVRHILDSVVEELVKDPARKFIYVEQAFFQLWHDRQTEKVKNQVQNLVATGQLEFVNGGWCMHDEANTHFIDMIDQTTLGHQYILKQFGKQPKVSFCLHMHTVQFDRAGFLCVRLASNTARDVA
jgi:alpha-mannosidase